MSFHEGCDHGVSGLDSDKGSRPPLTRNAADRVFARRTASAPVTLRAQIVTIASASIEAGAATSLSERAVHILLELPTDPRKPLAHAVLDDGALQGAG
eukprot:CAMPEP_0183591952 /NCGR_PEP_ID=MMETSP0371-20130417/167185_1 /TAXON_ID=268820 /ORGANISM="Peridinium aciculiferum, Strain PAER-2" /LENGTH=97 /DNA_ID=CAMNT_0025803443 /DNA_START=37 /DNA_END=328 /DNA_ORIENTATION=-